MNTINSIGRQTFFNYPYNAGNDKAGTSKAEFKDVYAKKMEEEMADRFNNYSKGISTPPVLLNKLMDTSEYIFEDVTYNEEYESIQENGPLKIYRTYMDNGEGIAMQIPFVIHLKVSSKDVKIDDEKLPDIFDKAIMFAKEMIPIYAKMNGTAILGAMYCGPQFNEATGTADFESFIKDFVEGTSRLATIAPVDDDTKAELQRMLKECEDFLLKSIKKKEQEKDISLNSKRKNVLMQKQVIDARDNK